MTGGRTLQPEDRVFVGGHRGLVGSAMVRRLEADGFTNLVLRSRDELDLLEPAAVHDFFASERPDCVILAAAKVGGIMANSRYPADFIRENLVLQSNVIEAARQTGVHRLLFLGSSCIYPREAPQPLKEEYLLTGPLEPTNAPYAVAKIAGIIMCQAYNRQYGTAFISAMPTNLYGPGDNFDLETSHVVPALIRKFHDARVRGDDRVVVWGTGTPRREFLHVDDLAEACVLLLRTPDAPEIVNVGAGEDVSIRELAETIARITGFEGRIEFDTSRPDGTPRKLLDVSRMRALGWSYRIPLEEGLRRTYDWFAGQESG
jgi:GDP-L-fucose synthase